MKTHYEETMPMAPTATSARHTTRNQKKTCTSKNAWVVYVRYTEELILS